MKSFRITLQHDSGKIRIKTTASSKDAAELKILKMGNCPPSAIIKTEELVRHIIFLN